MIAKLLGLTLALAGTLPAAGAATTLLTEMTGESGQVQYDFSRNPGNGWYIQAGNPYHFKLGFKQGERGSPHPIEVATVTVDPSEEYDGTPSIALQIIARRENRPRSTAFYKVSVSSKQERDRFVLPIMGSETLIHSFVMKIDPTSSIKDGVPIGFEQFWQGSPFAAPVGLAMLSANDARNMGWSRIGSHGNFALKLTNDDHAPLHRFRTKPEVFDLGPIVFGKWIMWRVEVVPSPDQPAGEVRVFRDGKQVADITHHKIGFDPRNPEYTDQKPSDQFRGVDILLYRKNGDSFQRVYFDDVSLSVTN